MLPRKHEDEDEEKLLLEENKTFSHLNTSHTTELWYSEKIEESVMCQVM